MAKKIGLDAVAMWLMIVGAINLGLTGVFDWNLLVKIVGTGLFATIVYGAIGAAGVFKVLQFLKIVK